MARKDYEPASSAKERIRKAIEEPRTVFEYVNHLLTKQYRKIRVHTYRKIYGNQKLEREIQGSLMRLSFDDPGLSTDLLIDGIREPLNTKIYKGELKKLMDSKESIVVVDIGANIGYFAFMPLAIDKEKFEVIAIEPEESNFNLLMENADLNDYRDGITFIQTAVGDEDDDIELSLSKNSNLHKIKREGEDASSKTNVQVVKQRTLPAILRDHGYNYEEIDVLRMDTEGYESMIVKGIPNLRTKNGLLISMEIHPNLLTDEEGEYLVKRFKDADAELLHSTYQGFDLNIGDWDDILDYRWLNIHAKIPST